jgi:hypothetical protein
MQQDRQPRHGAERNATQQISGQPREDDDEEMLEDPQNVGSRLTAREFAAPDPSGRPESDKATGEPGGPNGPTPSNKSRRVP